MAWRQSTEGGCVLEASVDSEVWPLSDQGARSTPTILPNGHLVCDRAPPPPPVPPGGHCGLGWLWLYPGVAGTAMLCHTSAAIGPNTSGSVFTLSDISPNNACLHAREKCVPHVTGQVGGRPVLREEPCLQKAPGVGRNRRRKKRCRDPWCVPQGGHCSGPRPGTPDSHRK